MKRFTSPGGAQRFLCTFSGISPHFRPRRHRLIAEAHDVGVGQRRRYADEWVSVGGAACAAVLGASVSTAVVHA
jgi:hypothetical protein